MNALGDSSVKVASAPQPLWRRLLSYRLAAPLAIVLAILVLSINEAGYRAAEQVTARRDAAVEIRLAVDRARRLALLMESAQRGYLLTGRPEYRVPFDAARAQSGSVIQSLRDIAQRVPVQRDAVLQLIEAIERRYSELSEVMRLYEAGERDRALTLTMTDIGREHMEQVNALVEEVSRQEEQAYVRGGQQRERVRFWSRVAIGAMVMLCLATVFAALRLSRERERERARHLEDLSRERDKLETEVVHRTQDLTELARHLQTVREDERSRLARELHDELGGLLTAAKLDVARVRKRVQGTGPEVAERIDHLGQTLDAGIALKRRIIEDLRPSSLDNLGLQRTLEIQCSEFARRSEIEVVSSIEDVELAKERQLVVYRLVQEALTNVAKYARARRVEVSLAQVDGMARVQVRDDGVGFDAAQVRVGAHGLRGMRFRVQSCGGRWALKASPGEGTLVQAEIPL